jgi:hypothetical protein
MGAVETSPRLTFADLAVGDKFIVLNKDSNLISAFAVYTKYKLIVRDNITYHSFILHYQVRCSIPGDTTVLRVVIN